MKSKFIISLYEDGRRIYTDEEKLRDKIDKGLRALFTCRRILDAKDISREELTVDERGEEEPTAHWVREEEQDNGYSHWSYHCDKCNAKAPFFWEDGEGYDCMVTPYCPQCGAKMIDWEDTNEEWYVHRDEEFKGE